MTNQIKVLIGNDAADCGMAWAGALKNAGMYAITRRCDGNSVLNSIKSEAPDAAVLEAKMPFCDAIEVIRRLKVEKKYVPNVIIVSNNADPVLEREAAALGASSRRDRSGMCRDRDNSSSGNSRTYQGLSLSEDRDNAFRQQRRNDKQHYKAALSHRREAVRHHLLAR